MNIIKVEQATKRFQDNVVLNNVNIDFEKGKTYGIIGRNGSGKTVLFKTICGFMPLTSGRIFVSDKQIGKDIDVPDDIGIIIEAPGFLPNYSAYRNLSLLASIKRKVKPERICEVLELVGLDPDNKKHVAKFSLGMRQRLGIAQAIMENPSILLLDEPMNGLDNAGVEDMRALFLKLKDEGTTIILASHNKEDIDALCDSVFSMDRGIAEQMR